MMRPASDQTARTAAPGIDTDSTLELGLHCGLPRPARRGVSLVAALALLLQPTLASLAQAQQIVDPRAPIQFRPGVGVSANGTPLVNITTPSFGGVSHNKFQRYDIDTRGVILNNSGYGGTSVIGGAVTANPNLASSRPASVIVNEVTGTGTSTLNGPTEVFGGRADVVVANPNGVGCVGCTFINAGRVTLTTGVPHPDYRAGTVSYAVTGGTVSVGGSGLKGGNGETLGRIDLIARQLRLDGPVVARETVRLRAGAMTYDAASDLATPLPGAGPVTGPAIASGADGTIRAGTISVLSRDADLGVSLDGALTALTGAIEIRSYGDLRLASSSSAGDLRIEADGAVFVSGRNEAVGRITVQGRAAELALSANLAANDAIVVETRQDLVARGTLVSGQDISLTAAGALVASGTVSALGRVALEGASVAADGLTVGAAGIAVAGVTGVQLGQTALKAQGDVTVSGSDVTLDKGTAFEAGGRLAVDARDGLTLGTVLDNPNLDLTIRNRLRLAAGGGLVQDVLGLALRGDLDNDGTLYGRTSTTLAAATLTNGATGTVYGPDVTVTLSGALTNLGSILSDRTLALTVAGLVRNDGTLATDGALTLRAQGYAAGARAAALTGRIADLVVTGAFENAGSVLGQEGLTLQAASLRNDGTVTGGGALTRLTLAGDVDNTGTLWGAGSLTLTAGGTIRTPGDVYAKAGDLTLTAAGAITAGADLVAGGLVSVRGASFDGGPASRVSGAAITAVVDGVFASLGQTVAGSSIDVTAGTITLGQTASVTAPVVGFTATGDLTNDGAAGALSRLLVTAGGSLANTGELLAASDDAAAPASGWITAGGDFTNSGRIQADDGLVLRTGAAFFAASSSLIAARTTTLTAGGGSTMPGACWRRPVT